MSSACSTFDANSQEASRRLLRTQIPHRIKLDGRGFDEFDGAAHQAEAGEVEGGVGGGEEWV